MSEGYKYANTAQYGSQQSGWSSDSDSLPQDGAPQQSPYQQPNETHDDQVYHSDDQSQGATGDPVQYGIVPIAFTTRAGDRDLPRPSRRNGLHASAVPIGERTTLRAMGQHDSSTWLDTLAQASTLRSSDPEDPLQKLFEADAAYIASNLQAALNSLVHNYPEPGEADGLVDGKWQSRKQYDAFYDEANRPRGVTELKDQLRGMELEADANERGTFTGQSRLAWEDEKEITVRGRSRKDSAWSLLLHARDHVSGLASSSGKQRSNTKSEGSSSKGKPKRSSHKDKGKDRTTDHYPETSYTFAEEITSEGHVSQAEFLHTDDENSYTGKGKAKSRKTGTTGERSSTGKTTSSRKSNKTGDSSNRRKDKDQSGKSGESSDKSTGLLGIFRRK